MPRSPGPELAATLPVSPSCRPGAADAPRSDLGQTGVPTLCRPQDSCSFAAVCEAVWGEEWRSCK
jgi:hypothetical protein